jgi:hypothetical protein
MSLPALTLCVILAVPFSSAQAPAPGSSTSTPVKQPISQLHLYRALFMFIAQMERDRLADPPTQLANMVEIEDHLRKKINLTHSQWQTLVSTGVKVNGYAKETSQQARAFADQDRASRSGNPLSANTLAAGRATLHKMQLDLNARVLGDIQELEVAVGADATANIHAYLNGPLAASAQVTRHTGHKKANP